MRFAIIDAIGTKADPRFDGMAVKYLTWELNRLGANIVKLPQLADIVLISTVSAGEWQVVPSCIKKYGINRRKQKIILGGQSAMSPKIFEDYVDIICVGEGRTFLETLVKDGFDATKKLANSWFKGDTKEVIPDYNFPYDIPPIKCMDGLTRIFASRGCRKKCLFCQVGWERPYSENSFERVTYLNRNLLNGHTINYVSNDLPSLSYFNKLDHYQHFSGSYSHLKMAIDDLGINTLVKRLGTNGSIRIGVESISERLRKFIGKPIESKSLLDITVNLLNAGIKFKWFVICGLPGERDDDYEELKNVVSYLKHHVTKGMLIINFTTFAPNSPCPLCIPPLEDSYQDRMERFYNWFLNGRGYTRRVRFFRGSNPETRLSRSIGYMGCTEDELRRGWLHDDPPNWRVKYAYRDKIRRAYNVYAKKVGLPIGQE